MTIQEIAKVAHNIQSVFCLSIGDASVPNWDNISDSEKESDIESVYDIIDEVNSGKIFATHSPWDWGQSCKEIIFHTSVRELIPYWE